MKPWERWYDRLLRPIPMDGATITVESRPATDPPALTMLLSRVEGIAEAMRDVQDLDLAPAEALHVLLDHVHRVTNVLEGFEEAALLAAAERGVSLRNLALTLDVNSPQTVANRLQKIRWANQRGYTAHAVDAMAADSISDADPLDE